MRQTETGFSLLELLVCLGIVAGLMALVIPVASQCITKAEQAREIAGARQAITAWRAFAAENDGLILPGYQAAPGVVNASGQTLRFPANARYVFRLAPYLDFRLKGTLLVNRQEKIRDDYEISMSPSFGINLTFVGGDFGGGSDLVPSEATFARHGRFAVTRMSEIHQPSKLLVFASARITSGDRTMPGYNAIKSPRLHADRWAATYTESGPYWDFGAVHPRFDGRAVCAMADGHVELLTIDDLRDMRRWSNQAAQADDPDWTLETL